MDEILEKMQRTIATEGLNRHQPAASPRTPAESRIRQMSDEEALSGKHSKPVMPESEERLLSPATARATAAVFAEITAIRRQQGAQPRIPHWRRTAHCRRCRARVAAADDAGLVGGEAGANYRTASTGRTRRCSRRDGRIVAFES